MKLLICADVQLGAVCREKLGLKQSHKWQETRTKKLTDLLNKAVVNHASYVALFGKLFGLERVSEFAIDDFFKIVKEKGRIQVLVFLVAEEYNRIIYRKEIPENLHLICIQVKDSYADENIAIQIKKGTIELRSSDKKVVTIVKSEKGFAVQGLNDEQIIPSYEPVGFEDAQEATFGYAILDWDKDTPEYFEVETSPKYQYKTVELRIQPEYDQKEILKKINTALYKMDENTVLRMILTGQCAFALTLNLDGIKNQLQDRFFSVEIIDKTVMDVDERSFENDISLKGEFVRLALKDDSLSDTERSRIISCGWNVLSGKGVPAD